MQYKYRPFMRNNRNRFARRSQLHAFLCGLMLTLSGCGDRPSTLDKAPTLPYSGIKLRIAVTGAKEREMVDQLGRSWATRNGAAVTVVEAPFDNNTDIGIIRPADMPTHAEAGILADLPNEVRNRSHSYQWDDLFYAYSARLLAWRDRVYALPVIGEGMVLVYKKSAFDGQAGRPKGYPQTWDELADLGPQSILPTSTDPEILAAQFLSALACYDRLAVNRANPSELKDRFFRFLFEPATGEPRVSGAVFDYVGKLFVKLYQARVKVPDLATATRQTEAKVGILTLEELAALPKEMLAQWGVAPLPGSAKIIDDAGLATPTASGSVNRVPYFGWGGRVGVVAKNSQQQAAAWEFLAELGSADQTGNNLIASGRWGAGPYRISHVEAKSRSIWFGYNLSAEETDRLSSVLRENIGLGVQNYRFHLRVPQQEALTRVFNETLSIMLKEQRDPKTTFQHIEANWKDFAGKNPNWPNLARASLGMQANR